MPKVEWKSGTFIYPIPAVMVSCSALERRAAASVQAGDRHRK